MPEKTKHTSAICIDKIASWEDLGNGPDGKPMINMVVEESRFVLEFEHPRKGRTPSLIIPGVLDASNVIRPDHYYCFVDTNQLKGQPPSRGTHATGTFIFRPIDVRTVGKGMDTITKWSFDMSSVFLRVNGFFASEGMDPERRGWDRAIAQLVKMGAERAFIFVDARLNEHPSINATMKKGFTLCYVSADRQPSSFNTMFSRLDRLIDQTVAANKTGPINVAIDYLTGATNHLNPQTMKNEKKRERRSRR